LLLLGISQTVITIGIQKNAAVVIAVVIQNKLMRLAEGKYKPVIPITYAGETMNGFEYQAAIHMIQEGMVEEGMEIVEAIRERYDGEKRNPWNEFECGSNYARSMASYALLNAFSGFEYNMVEGMIGFNPIEIKNGEFTCFWSLEPAWGLVEIRPFNL